MVGPTPNVPDGDISETPSCTVSMRSLTVQQPDSACHETCHLLSETRCVQRIGVGGGPGAALAEVWAGAGAMRVPMVASPVQAPGTILSLA